MAQQQGSGQAWLVVMAGTAVNLCLGVLYAWSVFAQGLQNNLGYTATQTSLPYSVAVILFALFMVPAGILLDRVGPRLVILISGILIGVGFIIAGMSLSVPALVIGFGVLGGAAMGFGYAAPTPSAVKWFKPHMKGMITGLVVSGYGLAAVYVSPLANYLIRNFGVANAFYYLGAFFTVLLVLLAFIVKEPPAGWVQVGGEPPAPKASAGKPAPAPAAKRDYTPGEMMGTWQFWSLWLMYAFSASAGLMMIGHVARIAQIQGGLETGFVFAALLAIGNAGGRILTGVVSDKIGRTATLILVFVIQAVNMFAYASYRSAGTLIMGAIITGAAYGALLALFPATTWDWFGLKSAGVNYGLVFTAWGVGGFFGPLMAGRIIDATGGYERAYIVSAILLLVAAGLGLITRAPKAAETPAAAAADA